MRAGQAGDIRSEAQRSCCQRDVQLMPASRFCAESFCSAACNAAQPAQQRQLQNQSQRWGRHAGGEGTHG